jgi:hypothetical protein
MGVWYRLRRPGEECNPQLLGSGGWGTESKLLEPESTQDDGICLSNLTILEQVIHKRITSFIISLSHKRKPTLLPVTQATQLKHQHKWAPVCPR